MARFWFIFITLALTLSHLPCSRADEPPPADDESFEYVAPDSPLREYEVQLQRERLKTALAKERAEQAFQEDRARHYEYQARSRDTYSERMEQERHYDQNRDEISTIGQTANTIATIVRQVQVLSGGGW